jgi:TonB family protein
MTESKSHKTIAASGSIAVHAALAILLMLALKDCGGGSGGGNQYMALNVAALGDSDMGSGDDPGAPSASAPTPQEPVEEEQVETQDDAPVVAPKTETTKPKETKPKETTKPVETTKPKETTNNTVNNALDALNNNKPGGGSGQSNPGGNEGRPDGSISGKGIFSGGGGSGNWALSGRTMSSPPSLDERPQSEATIVVSILVDRTGKVVSASIQDYTGGTEGRAKLEELAMKAARSASFSANPNGPINQKGTITINFKLK